VFRSLKHTQAQLVDDLEKRTLTTVNTTKIGDKRLPNGANIAAAKEVGKTIAEKAKGLGIKRVVFDRSGYVYHGRIKALAEAARKAGLEF
jgi:large subunit ribosomal protein L18